MADGRAVKCKRCGKECTWRKSKKGKWYLVEVDGEAHFYNCESSE